MKKGGAGILRRTTHDLPSRCRIRVCTPPMSTIRFLLDNVVQEIALNDSTRTVLQFLREDLRRAGTKEGCAEGDCGACTVVLAQAQGDELAFRAVNACILFLATLDGKALFTVESLRRGCAGRLHPVQQAMVDAHGSQCGFCTPGFVMSLFALYKSDARPDVAGVQDAISGNLCRCTGYRPIVDAGLAMRALPLADDADPLFAAGQGAMSQAERSLLSKLNAIRPTRGKTHGAPGRQLIAPVTVAELTQALHQQPQATLLAGGTDVGLWVTKQLRELSTVIYLGGVAQLNTVAVLDGHLSIGAGVTLTDAIPAITEQYPALAELFRRFASVPVRNSGTLVGNIANGSPIGDSMPALIALRSTLRLRSAEGVRELPLEAFYRDYQVNALATGEFVESLLIPLPADNAVIASYKLSKRDEQDISAVCAAFRLVLEGEVVRDIGIAFGGMAAIPKRASNTERRLLDQPWNAQTLAAAQAALAEDFTPLSDMRGSADYRLRAAAAGLQRFYLQTRTRGALSERDLNVFAS